MRVLVYCANGLQGQPIVHQLLRSDHQVRALVSLADRRQWRWQVSLNRRERTSSGGALPEKQALHNPREVVR
jgi:nucleoside-diphosphate-sugar epimerase